MGHRLRRGGLVDIFRCWNRRLCRNCAELMSWDDEAWIRRGVQHWLSLKVSLVFVTLTLADPKPYSEVSGMWRVFKQALDRTVKDRHGGMERLPFVRVFERQEKRFQRSGETAVHIHVLIAGLQYRGDRLGGRKRRSHYLKAEDLGVEGAVVTKAELQQLAQRYGFGPMLDITQVQASPDNPNSAYEVGRYLAKYLSKFEALGQWLPKGKQVVAGSQGRFAWAGPGVTRLSVRQERLGAARVRREADRAAQVPAHPSQEPEPVTDDAEPEQLELPIPWPPA